MASEKEAAPAAVPSDSPTTYSRRQLIKKPYHLFFFECPVKTVFCLVVLASWKVWDFRNKNTWLKAQRFMMYSTWLGNAGT